MTLEHKVSAEIYNEIIIDLISDYKHQLQQDDESIELSFIREFYKNLNEEKKEQFILFLDAFAMDIVSIILGGFDGSTKFGKFFGGFSISYEGKEMKPYLQEYFLSIYENDYENKTIQDIDNS